MSAPGGSAPAPAPLAADPGALAELARGLAADGVYDPAPGAERHFRIGAAPYPLSPKDLAFLTDLGPRLHAFYGALNRLWLRSGRGAAPAFAARWLDQGKPDDLLGVARMGRLKHDLPRVIRPDLLPTGDGFAVTELDSVPGGIGLTDALQVRYAALGHRVVGGADGMARGMADALVDAASGRPDPTVAVVVSEESASYRAEMRHLALRLKALGLSAHVLTPEEIAVDDAGLSFAHLGERVRVDVLYRFFELFDLAHVAHADAMLQAAKGARVVLTPPAKPHLEEKLAFALLHHPRLAPFWENELGAETTAVLRGLVPPTWVLDPAPVPPHAVIPGLVADGLCVQSWDDIKPLGQKARRLVIKPSGFSERAWGGRGVVIGHDVSEADWAKAVDAALAEFPRHPHVLQPFRKAGSVRTAWLAEGGVRPMTARPRLCPYYFVTGDGVTLGGVLATLVPPDKKRVHGMPDAVMVPCAAP